MFIRTVGSYLGTVQGAGNQDRGAARRNNRRDERDSSGFKGREQKGRKRSRAREPHVEEEEAVEGLCILDTGQPGE